MVEFFLDTVAIEPGEDFVEAIGDKVEGCRVLVAVIGPTWLNTLLARRDQPNDYLRIELAQALRRGVRIIPITIDDVSMPGETALPDNLALLVRRNAVDVRADTFNADMAPLVQFLERFLDEGSPESAQTTSLASSLAVPVTGASDLCLNHRTEFWKSGTDGRTRHKIFVWLEGSPKSLDNVQRVVYQLHPTFKNSKREIWDRESGFQLRTNGWGEFEIKADVYSKEGSQLASLARHISFA